MRRDGRRVAAWTVFVVGAAWAVWRMVLIIGAASTGLYFMSVAGRADAVASVMIGAAFVIGVVMALAVYAAWRSLRADRLLWMAAALLIAGFGLPLAYQQIIAILAVG